MAAIVCCTMFCAAPVGGLALPARALQGNPQSMAEEEHPEHQGQDELPAHAHRGAGPEPGEPEPEPEPAGGRSPNPSFEEEHQLHVPPWLHGAPPRLCCTPFEFAADDSLRPSDAIDGLFRPPQGSVQA